MKGETSTKRRPNINHGKKEMTPEKVNQARRELTSCDSRMLSNSCSDMLNEFGSDILEIKLFCLERPLTRGRGGPE